MATTLEAFEIARSHHQAGRLREAEALYRQILQADPNHADALHLLGVLAHQLGQHDAAVDLIGRAIGLRGDRAAFHSNLAEVYRTQGRLAEAEQWLRRALALDPNSADALNNLGLLLDALGRQAEAIETLMRAIAARTDFAEPHNNLGTLLQAEGKHAEAITHYRRAVALNSRYGDAYCNLGSALKELGQFDDAVEAYRQAMQLAPHDSELVVSLGTVYQGQGRTDEAMSCYREALRLDPRSAAAHTNLGTVLAADQKLDEAIAEHRAALAIDARLAAAHHNLGLALQANHDVLGAAEAYGAALQCQPEHVNALVSFGRLHEAQGRLDEALAYYEQACAAGPNSVPAQMCRAGLYLKRRRTREAIASYQAVIEAQPDNADAYNNLSVAYDNLGQHEAAVACCLKGLEHLPHSWELYSNLARSLGAQGRLDESLAAARKSVELEPASPLAFSNLVYNLNYVPDYDPERLFAEHLEWARRHAEPLTAAAAAPANDPEPERRLRVGYVSSHFRDHAVNFFVEPLLAAHDHRDFEIFCYADNERTDAVTERLKAAADHWRDVHFRRPEQLAAMVRDDKIDVLVDLAGHIAGNCLPLFARRPAPVQVTYLGYQNTTGMSAMDYRLTDALADPPGETDRYYTEQLVRLPDAFFCFRPADEAPPIAPLPARRNGCVTFGSFNNFKKVTPPTIDAWLEILSRVPNSRLLVLANTGGYVQQKLAQLARRQGLDPERIEIFDKCPRARFFARMQQADIALDPFPFNGHTTTCDAIWLGVPVVMLQGAMYASRFGSSVLANVGLDAWIAHSVEEYVATAARMAGDLNHLEALRAELRPRMAGSVLLDFPGFARKVEAAYRQMWRDWCASR